MTARRRRGWLGPAATMLLRCQEVSGVLIRVQELVKPQAGGHAMAYGTTLMMELSGRQDPYSSLLCI
jgi:hypothetical protein